MTQITANISGKVSKFLFRRNIHQLFKSKNIKVFEKHNFIISKIYFASASNCNINYICATYQDNLTEIKDLLCKNSNNSVVDFETPLVKALYFKDKSRNLNGLVFAPDAAFIRLDQHILNFSINIKLCSSIQEAAIQNKITDLINLNGESLLAIGNAYDKMILNTYNLGFFQLMFLKYLNMQNEYVRCYQDYKKEIFPKEYNHIEAFSRIYYWDLKIMSEIFQHNKIIIHDVATSLGHFPLMLSRLPDNDLMNVQIEKIIASDLKTFIPKFFIKRVLRKGNKIYHSLQIKKLDLVKNITKAPRTDVIIANDVLEHFPEDISLSILKGLWEKTNKLLLVHVPIEKTPNPLYGHLLAFNSEILRNWATALKGGILLSDNYTEDNKSLIEWGYLIMLKNGTTN